MKIGVIIFSKTNHTFLVAKKLNQFLLDKAFDINIERVRGLNTEPRDKGPIQLTNIPNIENYDILIFGSPVWAFSLPPAMKDYLEQLPLLYKKKIYLFVTMQFPFAFLGGNRAIKQMKKICTNKKADIEKTFVINWASKKRDAQISKFLESMAEDVN